MLRGARGLLVLALVDVAVLVMGCGRDDLRIRAVAERAGWLGNEETHYIRRWQDQGLGDLKCLINMTVN